MAFLIFAAILLMSHGIQSQKKAYLDPLIKLSDIITARLEESLKDLRAGEFSSYYTKLQQAAKLPFSKLDEKITALNMFRLLQRTDESFGSTRTPAIQNGSLPENGPALRQKFTQSEKKILNLLMRLGIYDNFTARVFKAIFSDEQQLKKLKKKLDDLDKKEMDDGKDSLWDFLLDLF
ncbi:uncharacterized protein LOC108050585 [Drosophila rhopaloa]|uniref:Uncharacterized protein LOC108050585 n=1 Tax=Drosophila rhopaloa TaxID=1041015 RepID=A0A6P4FK32_DRORH|nr:uncharacterized protein LOC108050585 [Drosophila rhopaloa]